MDKFIPVSIDRAAWRPGDQEASRGCHRKPSNRSQRPGNALLGVLGPAVLNSGCGPGLHCNAVTTSRTAGNTGTELLRISSIGGALFVRPAHADRAGSTGDGGSHVSGHGTGFGEPAAAARLLTCRRIGDTDRNRASRAGLMDTGNDGSRRRSSRLVVLHGQAPSFVVVRSRAYGVDAVLRR